MNTASEGAEAIRSDMACLAEALLRYYNVARPPVPVEQMLQEPPAGLAGIDSSKISSTMEHGMYYHAPRLAMARLLCREIVRSEAAMEMLGIDVSPLSHTDVKFFARCLLMPPHWVRRLVEQGLSVEQIGVYLQVPSYAVVTRLAELGLPIPDKR